MVGRQPCAPAAFTPGEIPDTHLQGLSEPQGTWLRRGEPRKKSPLTPPGIDPGTVRLIAQCLNHYASPGPSCGFVVNYRIVKVEESLLLLIKRYNLCKVPSCSSVFFQLSLSCATFCQFRTFILLTSSTTSSSQRVFGLPIGLLDMGFHLLIFCTLLSSVMRSTWPNQFNLCFLINPIIFCPFNTSLIS